MLLVYRFGNLVKWHSKSWSDHTRFPAETLGFLSFPSCLHGFEGHTVPIQRFQELLPGRRQPELQVHFLPLFIQVLRRVSDDGV
jgi:hypothetical protein